MKSHHLNHLARIAIVSLIPMASCATPPAFHSPDLAEGWDEQWHGHFSWPLGYRNASSDLGEADDLVALGILDFDLQPPGSPIAFALQILFAYTDDVPDASPSSLFANTDYTTVSQFNLGLRKTWYSGPWQPFVGGGISLVDVAVAENSYYYYSNNEFESDSTTGAWLGAGVHYSPGGGLLLGLSVQYLAEADVELAGRDIDAGGTDVMLLLGYSF